MNEGRALIDGYSIDFFGSIQNSGEIEVDGATIYFEESEIENTNVFVFIQL